MSAKSVPLIITSAEATAWYQGFMHDMAPKGSGKWEIVQYPRWDAFRPIGRTNLEIV